MTENSTFYNRWISAKTIFNEIGSTADDESAIITKTVSDVFSWIDEFITQPHNELKRTGAVCPFVKPALEENKVFFCLSDFGHPAISAIEHLLLDSGTRFSEIINSGNEKQSLLSLIILFPVWQHTSFQPMKIAKENVKPDFLKQGLTLGEFYPGNDDRSARNPELVIADSPAPMIIIRSLAIHDQLFLQSHPELYQWYMKTFPQKN